MYYLLLVLHSTFRWLVLMALGVALYRAARGHLQRRSFTPVDDKVRHWTATIAHIQLILGILLYIKSPGVQSFYANVRTSLVSLDLSFFATYHFLFMLSAIVVLTIGSAKAKRASTDAGKFETMLVWFSVATLIILIAVPWPFSPLAARPYLRI